MLNLTAIDCRYEGLLKNAISLEKHTSLRFSVKSCFISYYESALISAVLTGPLEVVQVRCETKFFVVEDLSSNTNPKLASKLAACFCYESRVENSRQN
jgi:hypothetical protein